MLPFNMLLNLTTAKSNNFKPFANLNFVITVEPLIQPGFSWFPLYSIASWKLKQPVSPASSTVDLIWNKSYFWIKAVPIGLYFSIRNNNGIITYEDTIIEKFTFHVS